MRRLSWDPFSNGGSPVEQMNYVDQPYDAEVSANAPGINEIPSSSPSWEEQLRQASSTPPGIEHHVQNELAGVANHMKPSQDGSQNKWLSSLAPILAGAAAVFGGASGNKGISSILGGVSQGYANHLMDQAKESAALKHESDFKTIDLAHKYLAELPGDVDSSKYPRLAELGQKIREQLVDGKLSNPKEAQDFILEFTHYKNDIEKEREDSKYEQEKQKAKAPYEAFQEFAGNQDVNTTSGAAWLRHYGGVIQDPEHPGTLTDPNIVGRRVTAGAAAERSKAEAEARERTAAGNRSAAAFRVSTQERGRNARAKDRLNARGGGDQKQFSTDFKAANANANVVDRLRPISDPAARQKDVYDYMLRAGHLVTIPGKGGQTAYYIGNGQVTTDINKAKAAIGKGTVSPNVMQAPPQTPFNDLGDEEDGEDFE